MRPGPSRSLFQRTANIVACVGLTVALRLLLFPAFGLQQMIGPPMNLGVSFSAEALRRLTGLLWQFARPKLS